jgi:hypothetical protein
MQDFTNEERLIRGVLPKKAGFLAGFFGGDGRQSTSTK